MGGPHVVRRLSDELWQGVVVRRKGQGSGARVAHLGVFFSGLLALASCSNGPAAPGSAGGGGAHASGGAGLAGSGGGGVSGLGGATSPGQGGGSASGGATGTGGGPGGGLGPFTGVDFGAVSNGGTITFQNIGAVGSYPSVCAPTGGACCRQTLNITSAQLTPWDEDLIMTLRGPMDVRQFAAYQPATGQGSPWQLVSSWDARSPAGAKGIAFTGDAAPGTTFNGTIGSVCLVNVSTDRPFGCGPASSPYCAATSPNKNSGWSGSKMFVLLASMPRVGTGGINTAQSCAAATNGWTDAPWVGLSVGELIRAGAFSSCQCYDNGNGCGQFNALEVINDNDTTGNYKNLDIFSSNFFSYGGIFGGPCGTNNCKVAGLAAGVDLVSGSMEAAQGALASQTPRQSPNAYFRRPSAGYRYFIILLDVNSRTVQMATIHPQNVPAALAALLPGLPQQVPQTAIDGILQLRLPH